MLSHALRQCFVLCFVSSLQQEVMEQFTADFANLEDDDEGQTRNICSV